MYFVHYALLPEICHGLSLVLRYDLTLVPCYATKINTITLSACFRYRHLTVRYSARYRPAAASSAGPDGNEIFFATESPRYREYRGYRGRFPCLLLDLHFCGHLRKVPVGKSIMHP
jgi:hypothetical protein